MSTQTNVALVQEAYAAFGAGDIEKLLGMMTPDIVWEFPASSVIPWAGTFTGPGEVAKFFSATKIQKRTASNIPTGNSTAPTSSPPSAPPSTTKKAAPTIFTTPTTSPFTAFKTSARSNKPHHCRNR